MQDMTLRNHRGYNLIGGLAFVFSSHRWKLWCCQSWNAGEAVLQMTCKYSINMKFYLSGSRALGRVFRLFSATLREKRIISYWNNKIQNQSKIQSNQKTSDIVLWLRADSNWGFKQNIRYNEACDKRLQEPAAPHWSSPSSTDYSLWQGADFTMPRKEEAAQWPEDSL